MEAHPHHPLLLLSAPPLRRPPIARTRSCVLDDPTEEVAFHARSFGFLPVFVERQSVDFSGRVFEPSAGSVSGLSGVRVLADGVFLVFLIEGLADSVARWGCGAGGAGSGGREGGESVERSIMGLVS